MVIIIASVLTFIWCFKGRLGGSVAQINHTADYSSKDYKTTLRKYYAIQSMSRVWNFLDNPVIEFWFSIFKTELIYRLDIKRMSFVELKQLLIIFIITTM